MLNIFHGAVGLVIKEHTYTSIQYTRTSLVCKTGFGPPLDFRTGIGKKVENIRADFSPPFSYGRPRIPESGRAGGTGIVFHPARVCLGAGTSGASATTNSRVASRKLRGSYPSKVCSPVFHLGSVDFGDCVSFGLVAMAEAFSDEIYDFHTVTEDLGEVRLGPADSEVCDGKLGWPWVKAIRAPK